jgi:hypothetical protein
MDNRNNSNKKKLPERWHPTAYGDTIRYKYWSEIVHGEGDTGLSDSAHGFRKFVVLRILSKEGSAVSIGFMSKTYRKTMVLDIREQVPENGFMYCLGMDKDDCDFFAASDDSAVRVELIGYRDVDDHELLEIPIY